MTLLSLQQRGERSAQQPKLIIQVKNSYGPDDGDAARSELTRPAGPIHRRCSTNDLHFSEFALRQASVLVLRQVLLMPET
jgi:hypothetical protein